MTKTITYPIVIGATGLVGKTLVQQLVNEPSCKRISVIVRKHQPEFEHWHKVKQVVVEDFLMLNDQDVSGHTHAFSCLGTTLKKAGSKEAFFFFFYTINAHFAELFQQRDAHYLLISALGANSNIQTLSLERISLFRPSLLIGERDHQRLLEDAAQNLFDKFSHFIPDSFKYKPVTAEQVAHTMVYAALNQTVKFEIYDNLAIQKMK